MNSLLNYRTSWLFPECTPGLWRPALKLIAKSGDRLMPKIDFCRERWRALAIRHKSQLGVYIRLIATDLEHDACGLVQHKRAAGNTAPLFAVEA